MGGGKEGGDGEGRVYELTPRSTLLLLARRSISLLILSACRSFSSRCCLCTVVCCRSIVWKISSTPRCRFSFIRRMRSCTRSSCARCSSAIFRLDSAIARISCSFFCEIWSSVSSKSTTVFSRLKPPNIWNESTRDVTVCLLDMKVLRDMSGMFTGSELRLD